MTILVIALASAGAVIVLALILFTIYILRGRASGGSSRVTDDSKAPRDVETGKADQSGGSRKAAELGIAGVERWALKQVEAVTEQFSASRLVEDGGHSSVYKGQTPDGTVVAVKRAKKSSMEGKNLFKQEVEFMAECHQENIVDLLAYCDEGREQILVFRFAENGSLADWLRPPEGDSRPPLSFEQRLTIARQVANAIQYLHSKTPPTLHRDIKSATILLDGSFQVKVGGLGTMKHLPGGSAKTRMERKKGYLDPEYFQLFSVTDKSDVYSLGVVMLELITARPPVVEERTVVRGARTGKKPTTLTQWALPRIKDGRLAEIIDPRLQDYPEAEMHDFIVVAASCSKPTRITRPSIGDVASKLQEISGGAAPATLVAATSSGPDRPLEGSSSGGS